MNLIENIDGLVERRTQSVRNNIAILSLNPGNIRLYQRPLGGVAYLGLSESSRMEIEKNVREWRVDCYKKGITLNYFEAWVPLEKGNYYLEKAYLHLYQNSDLIICIHSDPNEPTQDNGGYIYREYKQSPHIHMSILKSDLKKAHIALSCDNLDECIYSLANFDFSMFLHIEMIKKEVIDRI